MAWYKWILEAPRKKRRWRGETFSNLGQKLPRSILNLVRYPPPPARNFAWDGKMTSWNSYSRHMSNAFRGFLLVESYFIWRQKEGWRRKMSLSPRPDKKKAPFLFLVAKHFLLERTKLHLESLGWVHFCPQNGADFWHRFNWNFFQKVQYFSNFLHPTKLHVQLYCYLDECVWVQSWFRDLKVIHKLFYELQNSVLIPSLDQSHLYWRPNHEAGKWKEAWSPHKLTLKPPSISFSAKPRREHVWNAEV